MVLAIKLHDNIFIPQSIIDSGKHLLGLNYNVAQNKIKGLFGTNRESEFQHFITEIFVKIKPDLMFNLYHLVDCLSISELLIENDLHNNNVRASNPAPKPEMLLPIDNYLNYLGFEIKAPPNLFQFGVLILLKQKVIIKEFWLEGETRPIKSPKDVEIKNVFVDKVGIGFPSFVQLELEPIQQPLPANPERLEDDFLSNLNFKDLENRGAGSTIIIVETDATKELEKIGNKVNIQHLSKPESLKWFGDMGDGSFHQLQTLITLYGNQDGKIKGLVPEANLVVCSLQENNELNPEGDKKRKKDILSHLRLNLFKTLEQKGENAILLFEFETLIPIPLKDNKVGREYFPTCIIYDINERFKDIAQKHNTIVVGGVGNNSKDFNHLDPPIPWELPKLRGLEGYKYVNLNQRNLPLIMVGAVELAVQDDGRSDFTIDGVSNFGKQIDVFMYTNFTIGGTEIFQGTSGASAAVAGIVAFLQGRALSGLVGSGDLPSSVLPKPRKLTTQMIKNVFENTFMKTFSRSPQTNLSHKTSGIIQETTLKKLWEECEKQLKPSQHQ